jgi:hypothetical protein
MNSPHDAETKLRERRGQDADLNACRCGPKYPGRRSSTFLSRGVYLRAVFARMSYSPVGIVMGVNWVSHFRYLVED